MYKNYCAGGLVASTESRVTTVGLTQTEGVIYVVRLMSESGIFALNLGMGVWGDLREAEIFAFRLVMVFWINVGKLYI